MRCLADFARELAEATTDEERLSAIFKGLVLNVFTCGLRKIDQLNLATLELREPHVFETVKDKDVRRHLVRIGVFEVNVFKNPDKDAVELGLPSYDQYGYGRVFEALYTIGAYKFSEFFETVHGTVVSPKDLDQLYGGPDAVAVFHKSLHALCKYLYPPGDYRPGSFINENYRKLLTWLSLDNIQFVTHRRRIEEGMGWLGPIYGQLETHKLPIR